MVCLRSIVYVKYCMNCYLDNCSKRFHSSYEWNNARWSSGKRRKKDLQILPKSSNSVLPHCYSCWQIGIAKNRPTVSCMVWDWIWYARLYILEVQILVELFNCQRVQPNACAKRVWFDILVDKAAYEFSDTEIMLQKAEELCGPYVWGIYDILVLPPSFPYGGMENPCLTFATPTLLVSIYFILIMATPQV